MKPLFLVVALGLACSTSAGEKQPHGDETTVARAPSAPAPQSANAEAPAEEAAAPVRGSAEPGEMIPAFQAEGLKVAAGGAASAVAIDSRKTERPTAYVFVGTRCATTAKYLERLAALEKKYQGAVDFVYLYPNRTDTADEKKAFHARHRLGGPMVDDAGARIALMLGGERTAELVLAGKDGRVVYRGAIDDNKVAEQVKRKHALIAIDEHLAGKPVSQPKTIGAA